MPRRGHFAKKGADVRHFKLVCRSSADPLAEDPEAPALVLEPFVKPNDQRRTGMTEEELLKIPESLEKLGAEVFGSAEPLPRKTSGFDGSLGDIEEDDDDSVAGLDDDCYCPKDGYNYEQHLKNCGVGKKGGVVGVILEAPKQDGQDKIDVEKAKDVTTGMAMSVDKPVAQTTEEADIMRALEFADEYDEFENEELDGILPSGAIEEEVVIWGPTALEYQDLPDLTAFRQAHAMRMGFDVEADDDEAEPGSPSAAAPSRINEAEFAKFLADEYADDEIGDCEEEEIAGPIDIENMENILDEYLQDQEDEREHMESVYEPQRGVKDDVPRVIEETKAIIEKHYLQEESEESTDDESDEEDESRNWDCETVLSTLSNLSNRPGKIGKIKVIGKKPLKPLTEVTEAKEEAESEEEEEDIIEIPDAITERKKGETPEEKRARKQSVKELRKVCRQMKKESKQTYKEEAAKLPGKVGNGDVRQKLRIQKL